MTARKRQNGVSSNGGAKTGTATKSTSKSETKDTAKIEHKKQLDEKVNDAKIQAMRDLHLVPIFLLFTILTCSGALCVMAYRDMFGTGKVIFGTADQAMLDFTRSTKWFDDGKGWKSSQGGFSAVQQITTDDNDMGGFFIRKIAGAAALAFHLQKLVPLIYQPTNVHWGLGHFTPMLVTSVLGNVAVAAFYISHLDDLKNADAGLMGFAIITTLVLESFVIAGFILTLLLKKSVKLKAPKLPPGKRPSSMVSNILTRTICIVSGLTTLIAGRDFFFPGHELPFPPYDDIYLEWTGAFIHSPPPNTVEEDEHGLEAPLHIGDKFISRLGALYILIICFQKFSAAILVRVGKDNSGPAKCKMFWKAQAIANGLILFTFRVFAPAAKTASLDFRWHIMSLGYELFILSLYGYF
mmetsp:Transcript_15059/g.22767  ORF Transcript_15059/g.22767 Transcript_15059/m.22767 type:complete len:410 (-) Transcript_15059:83-1312(-)